MTGDVLGKACRGPRVPNGDISPDELLKAVPKLVDTRGIGEQKATAGERGTFGGRDVRSGIVKRGDSSPADVCKEIGAGDVCHHSRKDEMDRQIAELSAESHRCRQC